jgi:hypothetical protein
MSGPFATFAGCPGRPRGGSLRCGTATRVVVGFAGLLGLGRLTMEPPVGLGRTATCYADGPAPAPAASVYDRRPRPDRIPPAARPGAGTTTEVASLGSGEGDRETAAQAERIVAGALATFGRAASFSTRLRQKARIGSRVLVGSGRYVQSGHADEQRFRFESTLECDTESFETLDVCDGLFCWSYQRDGGEVETLRRVDVRRVRERLEHVDPAAAANPAPHLGGLQRSLWMLRQWFRFTAVDAAEVDGASVWIVEGRWDPERLAATLPRVVEAAGGANAVTPRLLPDGVPWSVRIVVGKSDLLVRRVEWLAIPGTRPVGERPVEPIAVLDLFDIQVDGPIDAAAFFYQPATTGLIDLTEEHLKRLAPMRP